MGNVCDKIATPDPKNISMTDKTSGDILSTNPCGLFVRADNNGYTSGYTLESLENSLVQYPPNYCIRYGPLTWLGPLALVAVFVVLIIVNTTIPEVAPAADMGLEAAATGIEAGVDASADVGAESIEMADMAGLPEEAADDAADDADDSLFERYQKGNTKFQNMMKSMDQWGDRVWPKVAQKSVYWGAPAFVGGVTAASVASVSAQLAEMKTTADQIDKFCTSIGDLDKNGNSQWISGFTASIPEKEYQNWMLNVTPGSDSCSAGDVGPNYQTFPKFGVCKDRCPNPGKKPMCVRNKVGNDLVFSGNAVSCCFADYRINGDGQPGDPNPSSCYEDPATKQRTCHPWYRDLSSTTCQVEITPYCLGDAMVPDQKKKIGWKCGY